MGDAASGDPVGEVWRLAGRVGIGGPAAALASTACSAPESEEEDDELNEEEMRQEDNLKYVAITRAKYVFTYVIGGDR